MPLTTAPCNQCNQQCQCEQCAPTLCTDGCLDFPQSKCVLSSKDVELNGTVYPKGTTQESLNDVIFNTLVNGVPTNPSQDIKFKVSPADSANGYLEDKLVGSTNITLTKLNPGNTESVRISTKVSSQAGNALSSLSDGLYVSPSSGSSSTQVLVTDTPTIDMSVSPVSGGYQVSGTVKISTDVGNSLVNGTTDGGLYVNVPSVTQRTVSGSTTDTAVTNVVLTGSNYQVFSNAKIDNTGDNILTSSTAGLKVSAAAAGGTAISVTDTNTIDLTKSGNVISGDVKIDPASTATVTSSSSGLKIDIPVTPPPALIVSDTNTINHTLSGATLSSQVTYQDTNSVDLFENGSGLGANIKLDPSSTNKASITGSGLLVSGDCDINITTGLEYDHTSFPGDLDLVLNSSLGTYIFQIYMNGILIDTVTKILTFPFVVGSAFTVNSTILAGVVLSNNDTIEWVISRSCSSTTKIIKHVYRDSNYITDFVNIPSGSFLNSWAPDATDIPKYRIQDGVLYLQGLVSKSLSFPVATNGTFNSAIIDLSTLTGYSSIKSVTSGNTLDYFGTRDVLFTASTLGAGQLFISSDNLLIEYHHNTTGSTFVSTRQIGLGGLTI